MPEQKYFQTSQNFVNEFFFELIRAKKHPKRIKLKEEKHKKIQYKSILKNLTEEAEQIQTLQEKVPEIPIPVIRPRRFLPNAPVPRAPFSLEKKIHAQIDLGKLNEFVNDSQVTLIQCDGHHVPIKINKRNQTIKTKVALNEQEIREILNKFSLRTNKPLTEPIFRAQTSGLEITAVISHYSSPKFVIVKR